MNHFIQWLQGEDRNASSRHQEIAVPDAKEERAAAIDEKIDTKHSCKTFCDTDIYILEQIYGKLTPGMTISLELGYACDLLGRSRKRVDAFTGLQKKLKDDYDVVLKINSRKTHV